MKTLSILAAILFGICASARAADDNPTAFALIKEGNRYIGEQAKDRVMEVHSDKSVGSLTPRVWHVIYFDPTATFKSVEVKFSAGKMMDVKRPFRVIETIGGAKEMDREKLKIDSDAAIATALKEPILTDVTPKSVTAKLENSDTGPVWKIRVWAAKLNHPVEQANLGVITVTADDGKVVENDIHINRVED